MAAAPFAPVSQVHFFHLYLRLRPSADGTVAFAVPCGAAGHLAAGTLAQAMGLPIKLIGATNANDALCQLLTTGACRGGLEPTFEYRSAAGSDAGSGSRSPWHGPPAESPGATAHLQARSAAARSSRR